MVKFTVAVGGGSAGEPGAVPVIVTVPVPVCGPPPPPQPATTTNTSIAATIPKRARRRWVIGIVNNNTIPSARNTTSRSDDVGGVFSVSGGTTNDMVATTFAVAI